jgi:hypothetical protein
MKVDQQALWRARCMNPRPMKPGAKMSPTVIFHDERDLPDLEVVEKILGKSCGITYKSSEGLNYCSVSGEINNKEK